MIALLVRHGLAIKNLEDRHGYSAQKSGLAPGYYPILANFSQALSQLVHFEAIYSSDFDAALATAEEIAKHQAVQPVTLPSLRAIDLGLTSGLSMREIERDFPGVAQQLSQYEAGHLHPKDFQIPGYESLQIFEDRVRESLKSIAQSNPRYACVVAHRSIITMLLNICRNHGRAVVHGTYDRFDLQPLSVSVISCTTHGTCAGIRAIGLTIDDPRLRFALGISDLFE